MFVMSRTPMLMNRELPVSGCRGEAREEFFAVKNNAHGVNEVIARAGFGDVAPGTYIGKLAHHLRRIMHGEKENSCIGFILQDLQSGLDAAHPGHANVQNQKIGMSGIEAALQILK